MTQEYKCLGSPSQKITWVCYIIALIIAGFFILAHKSFYQGTFNNEHQLNLYAFNEIARGKTPYFDFWWPYGPLGLYYYGFFLRILGTSVFSVLTGQALLSFFSGIFLFYNISLFFKKNVAFIGSIIFWIHFKGFDFYNYAHQAAFPLIFLSLTGLFCYIKDSNKNKRNFFKCMTFFCCILTAFVRINIGLSLLFAYFLIFLILDCIIFKFEKTLKIKKSIFGFLLSLLTIAIFYGAIAFQLSDSRFFQCFPYLDSAYKTQTHLFEHIGSLTYSFLLNLADFKGLTLIIIFAVSLIGVLIYITKKNPSKNKKIFISLLISLPILWIFLFHEFLMGFQEYRIWWLNPVNITMSLCLIGFLFHETKGTIIRQILFILMATISIWTFAEKQKELKNCFIAENFVPHPKFNFFTNNDSSLYALRTAHIGTFMKNLKITNFQLLSVPFEPFYYYFLNISSPTWHVLHCYPTRFINDIEKEMMQLMHSGVIQYIVISDSGIGFRLKDHETLLNVFYSKYIIDYITLNYIVLKEYGEWQSSGKILIGQSNVTTILKRKELTN